jgi:hypothetical protein
MLSVRRQLLALEVISVTTTCFVTVSHGHAEVIQFV